MYIKSRFSTLLLVCGVMLCVKHALYVKTCVLLSGLNRPGWSLSVTGFGSGPLYRRVGGSKPQTVPSLTTTSSSQGNEYLLATRSFMKVYGQSWAPPWTGPDRTGPDRTGPDQTWESGCRREAQYKRVVCMRGLWALRLP